MKGKVLKRSISRKKNGSICIRMNNIAHWERKNEWIHITSEQNILTMYIYSEDKITVNKYWTLVGRFIFQSSMG